MGLVLRDLRNGNGSCTSSTMTWVDDELADCDFQDARLSQRFRMLLKQNGTDVGQSIPLVCQDWANTKQPIDFSPMAALAKWTSFPAILHRRVSGWQRRTASF